MTIKLRKPTAETSPNGHPNESPEPIALKPMAISGVCVTKEALVEALKIYLPTIQNIQAVENEAFFLITLGPGSDQNDSGSTG